MKQLIINNNIKINLVKTWYKNQTLKGKKQLPINIGSCWKVKVEGRIGKM